MTIKFYMHESFSTQMHVVKVRYLETTPLQRKQISWAFVKKASVINQTSSLISITQDGTYNKMQEAANIA